MAYEVYIDVRHHPKHADDWEQVEQTAFKMADTVAPLLTVADCLRMFADEIEGRAFGAAVPSVTPPDETPRPRFPIFDSRDAAAPSVTPLLEAEHRAYDLTIRAAIDAGLVDDEFLVKLDAALAAARGTTP